jgi:hypothetical protein
VNPDGTAAAVGYPKNGEGAIPRSLPNCIGGADLTGILRAGGDGRGRDHRAVADVISPSAIAITQPLAEFVDDGELSVRISLPARGHRDSTTSGPRS